MKYSEFLKRKTKPVLPAKVDVEAGIWRLCELLELKPSKKLHLADVIDKHVIPAVEDYMRDAGADLTKWAGETDMSTKHPPEPSYEDLDANRLGAWKGIPTMALWYPQMGGYVGKAVAVMDGDCVDVWVWHDGEFPFADDDEYRGKDGPKLLHHCVAEQFVEFGKKLEAFRDD